VEDDPHLWDGQRPLVGPEADARATGDTAEAAARGIVHPTRDLRLARERGLPLDQLVTPVPLGPAQRRSPDAA
jgi:hypothetical protein